MLKGQPPNIWRPQQFYTGRVGAPPPDAPASTASEWNKEAPTSGHAEALFAEKAAKPSPSNLKTNTHLGQPDLPAEVKIQLPVTAEALASALSSATMHTVLSVATKPDGDDESKPPRVVTFEVPASDAVIGIPADEIPQVASAA